MNETKAIVLCGGRIAIPVFRDLFFYQQLAAIIIPEHCTDFIEEARLLLKDSVPIITINKENLVEKIQRAIKEYKPTIGIVFGFSFKIPPAVYTMPPNGFYNIHPGPLPSYRGPDPVFRQIKNREPYATVTIHKIDDGFDSGPVVLSERIRLSVTDTHGLLTTRLSELATIMVATLMKMAVFETQIPSRVQDESKANYYKRQAAADISINWQTMNAADMVALINACNPWNKGAVTKINNKILRLLAAHKGNPVAGDLVPGTVLFIDKDGITVTLSNNETLVISLVYCDEGFLPAERLKEFAMVPGSRFDSLY